MHYHMPAVNFLVHGRKRWFLLPPRRAIYSRWHPLSWFTDDGGKGYGALNARGNASMWECVQQPGEALMVPELWGHAVLNIESSVGAAFEYSPKTEPRRPHGDHVLWTT